MESKFIIRGFKMTTIMDPVIKMPKGAKILKIGRKKTSPIVWAMFRENAPIVNRLIRIYTTDEELPAEPGEYINTIDDIGYEFHLFDKGEQLE